jgi:hypothetical protein
MHGTACRANQGPIRGTSHPARFELGLLAIDGCADLGPGGRPGLGAYAL